MELYNLIRLHPGKVALRLLMCRQLGLPPELGLLVYDWFTHSCYTDLIGLLAMEPLHNIGDGFTRTVYSPGSSRHVLRECAVEELFGALRLPLPPQTLSVPDYASEQRLWALDTTPIEQGEPRFMFYASPGLPRQFMNRGPMFRYE